MGLVDLFVSFSGRINRKNYWFGLIMLMLVSPFSVSAILSPNPFQEAFGAIRELGSTGFFWSIALLLPLAALNTKRLHDLGQSGLIGVLFYLPAALSALTLFTNWSPPGFDQVMSWTVALAGFFGAASAWFLFKLGFQSGERGPNKYGPDPAG